MKSQDNVSMTASHKSDYENMSQTAIIADHRQKIQKLQLKSANYKQKEKKLKRDNDYLKKQIQKLEMTVEKLEEHREQDAEALLAQEQRLSELKGRYRTTDNPAEAARTKKSTNKLAKEENQLLAEVKEKLDSVTDNYGQLAQVAPEWYEQLRKLKFYGDKQMNEILLRQIHIYVEQLQEKSQEYTKQKQAAFDDNKNLRKKLLEKYRDFEQLKSDTLDDYKQWFGLQRKLNFYETDFMIEREELDKTK